MVFGGFFEQAKAWKNIIINQHENRASPVFTLIEKFWALLK